MLQKLKNKTDQPGPPGPSSSIGVSDSILNNKSIKVESTRPPNSIVPEKLIVEKPPTIVTEPKISAENVRTDLKIKIANVNKNLLDLEMQNITGEISDEIFDEKTKRFNSVKVRLENQLKEIEELK